MSLKQTSLTVPPVSFFATSFLRSLYLVFSLIYAHLPQIYIHSSYIDAGRLFLAYLHSLKSILLQRLRSQRLRIRHPYQSLMVIFYGSYNTSASYVLLDSLDCRLANLLSSGSFVNPLNSCFSENAFSNVFEMNFERLMSPLKRSTFSRSFLCILRVIISVNSKAIK
jgi:hypothetical protein